MTRIAFVVSIAIALRLTMNQATDCTSGLFTAALGAVPSAPELQRTIFGFETAVL
jgi:hypothetical protein